MVFKKTQSNGTTVGLLARDVLRAARGLIATPLFTVVAILSLALGIGANTAIFTLLNISLWKPLPVKHDEQIFQLMRVSSEASTSSEFSYPYPLFQQLSQTVQPSGELFATGVIGLRKFGTDAESTERAVGQAVSANFFSALYVQPALGREFISEDDSTLGGNHVAVLSYAFWVRRFHSDTTVLGKTVFYDEASYTIIGVADHAFSGMEPGISVDVWVPITAVADKASLAQPDFNWLRLLTRLQPGVDPAQLQVKSEAVFRAYATDHLLPGASQRSKQMLEHEHLVLRPARSGLATMGRKYENLLLILFGLVIAVLLISCGNLTNLMLARNAARRHNTAIRFALGATRAQIAWQFFAESLLLGVAGAACSLIVAVIGARGLLLLLPQSSPPVAFDVSPDPAVFAFTAIVTIGSVLLVGLGPALRAANEKVGMNVHGGQRIAASSVNSKILLFAQIALSIPLLVAAGLFLKTVYKLQANDLGFQSENVLTFDVSFPTTTDKSRVRQDYTELKERLQSHSGITAVSYAWPGVYDQGGWTGQIEVPGHSTSGKGDNDVGIISTGPDFFECLRLSLLQGRYLNIQDQSGKPPVVVINESLARSYFGSDSPLGKELILGGVTRQIVGVVADARHYGVREKIWHMVYVPHWERPGSFFVRSPLAPESLAGMVRNEVAATSRVFQVERIRPLEMDIDNMISAERATAMLSTIFALLASLLASLGLYGVVAYSTSRRTSEFGIRMALGAQRSDIYVLVLRQPLSVILIGVGVGVIAALILSRVLQATIGTLLFGVQTTDILVFVAASALLVVVSLCAAFVPAYEAAKSNPITMLRYE